MDAVALARELIRCPSVTPADAGALDVIGHALKGIGFTVERADFNGITNLYARRGSTGRNFCFAGHSDVVPPGNESAWTVAPFSGEIRDGHLFGRGAADMKGAIASFIAAAATFNPPGGSISLLITGDEEGVATDGTVKVLEWLKQRGEIIDHCVVGEPTNPDALGDMIKIGRRGSLNVALTVTGIQGHVAYPERADNPVPRLLAILNALTAQPLDAGTAHFPPSNLEITSIDVGNPTTNVIPAQADARFNIRFNDTHTGASLMKWIEDTVAGRAQVLFQLSGDAFHTEPGPFVDLVSEAIRSETGRMPELSTSGGTSDARFISKYCPVLEFGLAGKTMHKIDEHVPVADITALQRIYQRILERYFSVFG